jgi:Na+/serine symporter
MNSEARAAVPRLHYAAAERVNFLESTKDPYLRLALACWLVPLLLGITIFVVWLFRRSESLELAGLFTIALGTVLAAIGALLVLVFVFFNVQKAGRPKQATLLPAVLLLVLIALNFAAADAILKAVDWMDAHHPTQEQIDRQHDAG